MSLQERTTPDQGEHVPELRAGDPIILVSQGTSVIGEIEAIVSPRSITEGSRLVIEITHGGERLRIGGFVAADLLDCEPVPFVLTSAGEDALWAHEMAEPREVEL